MAPGWSVPVAAVLAAFSAAAAPTSMPSPASRQALSTAPAEEDGVASAIAKAPNATAAAAAYMAARNLDRSNPKIPRAYVQRLLEMGQPQLAATAAGDLVELDPKDALGQGVIGYLAAQKGNMTKAVPALVKAARSDPDNAGVAYDMGMLAIWLIRAGDNTVAASDQQEFMETLKGVQSKRGFYDGQLYCKQAFDKCQAAANEQRDRLPQLQAALAAAQAAGPELDLQLRTLNDRAAAADKVYRQMQIDKQRFLADSKSPNSAQNAQACEVGIRNAVNEARQVKQQRGGVERAVAQRNARILQCKKDVDRAQKIIDQGAKAAPMLMFRPPAVKGMIVAEINLPGSDDAPPVDAGRIAAIRTAATASAAGEAYANARTVNARDAQVYRAYIRRLLELNQPRMCSLPAQDLVRLDSQDAMACGVLAYNLGAAGKTVEAAALLARAIKGDADNAGIIHNLGMLSVWQKRTSDKNFSPEFTGELNSAIVAARDKPAFAIGAAAAKAAFDKRDAAPRKAAPPPPGGAQSLSSQQQAYYQAQYAEAQNGVDRYRNDKSAAGVAQYRAFELRRQAALVELRRTQEIGGAAAADAKPDPPLPWQPPAVGKGDALVQAPAPPPVTQGPKTAAAGSPEMQLKMAKMLLSNDLKERAAKILQEIILNHGDTEQAKEAKELLAKMGLQLGESTMNAKSIGLGVIGINPRNMGSTMTLLRGQDDLRYTLVAACARRKDVLEDYARQAAIPFATTDYRELVNRPEVDVVAVYSPDALHAEHCLAALEAGKHVVCTKPMVTDLNDARALAAAVRRSGKKFLVGQTMRFDRQFATLRDHFTRGDLGQIMAAEAFYIHDMRPVYAFTPWRLTMPQDFLYGGVTHPVDILRSFLGDVAEVHCYASKGRLTSEYPLANNFLLNLRFAGGAIAQVRGLYDIVEPPLPMMQVTLFGDGGTAVAQFTDNAPGKLQIVLDRPGEKESTTTDFPPERDASVYGHGATVIRYMRHFQQCLDEDLEPSPGVIDGAKACAVAAAAWQSARTGKPVKVFNEF